MEAIRAERLLDLIQAQAAPHMEAAARTSFLDGLLAACRGVVDDVAVAVEQVIWNGTTLGTARAIKSQVAKVFGHGAVA
jgi:predicted DNA-binding protein (UPF0251 family)